jgi:hypothetical protein
VLKLNSTTTEAERKNGWTLWREIYGTVLGTLPFVLVAIGWASNVNQRLSIVELEVQHAKQIAESDRANARDDRIEAGRKLDKIIDAVTVLQQQVARQGAGRATP